MMIRVTRAKKNQHNATDAFTLTELLVGALIASLTVTAGLKLSQVIVNNNKQVNGIQPLSH